MILVASESFFVWIESFKRVSPLSLSGGGRVVPEIKNTCFAQASFNLLPACCHAVLLATRPGYAMKGNEKAFLSQKRHVLAWWPLQNFTTFWVKFNTLNPLKWQSFQNGWLGIYDKPCKCFKWVSPSSLSGGGRVVPEIKNMCFAQASFNLLPDWCHAVLLATRPGYAMKGNKKAFLSQRRHVLA